MLRRHARKADFVVITGKRIEAPGAKRPRRRKAKTEAKLQNSLLLD
jgi:hypothetical protein